MLGHLQQQRNDDEPIWSSSPSSSSTTIARMLTISFSSAVVTEIKQDSSALEKAARNQFRIALISVRSSSHRNSYGRPCEAFVEVLRACCGLKMSVDHTDKFYTCIELRDAR